MIAVSTSFLPFASLQFSFLYSASLSTTLPGSTATATATAHGFKKGESVKISGADQGSYNGKFTITSTTANTFSFTVSGTPASPATGTITARRPHDVFSNDVLTAIRYPDKSSGSAAVSEQESFTVNALGEPKITADRNGNVHSHTIDILGRFVVDAVTNLGTGVDGTTRRLEFAFNDAGLPYLFTSYDAFENGNVLNQVERVFNGLGQLTTEYQEHFGAVTTGSAKVQYEYTEMSGGANHSRITKMTYPDDRILHYAYNSGLDSNISRLSFLADDDGGVGQHLEDLTYLGLSTIVERRHPEAGVKLTYISQSGDTLAGNDGGDKYVGLDRFGRKVDQWWATYNTGTGAVTGTTDRFQYGYDRDSNVLYKNNLQNPTSGTSDSRPFSELYHANSSASGDDNTAYDPLGRLTNFRRGTLSSSGNNGSNPDTISTSSRTQSWSLDALGNWGSVTSDGTTQTRGHNSQNQITSISGAITPTFDANGNTTKDETNIQYRFDAWNRIASITKSNKGYPYGYDALGRRIVEGSAPGTFGGDQGSTGDTHLYYDSSWQVLQESTTYDSGFPSEFGNGVFTVLVQNVWSPAYIDAMVLRDVTITEGEGDGGGLEGANSDHQIDSVSTLGVQRPVPSATGRLYVQQDANWNVTAVTNTSGTVQERYIYDPYGKATRKSASWGTPGTDSLLFNYLHQGGRFDQVTLLYGFRNRDLSPSLGRWIEQDPIGYVDGMDLYQLEEGAPLNHLDPFGLTPNQYDAITL
jgi:RHS repeat-associated protein